MTFPRRTIHGGPRRTRATGRLVSAGAGLLGLALVAGGCATDPVVGADGPVTGGVAAEVGDRTISVDDVDTLVDSYCVILDNDQQTASSGGVPRAFVQDLLLEQWVQSSAVNQLGDAIGVKDAGAGSATDPETVPGWSEMSEREQEVFSEYLEEIADLRPALAALTPDVDPGADQAEVVGATYAALGDLMEEHGIDVAINPRYQADFVDGRFHESTSLSVDAGEDAGALAAFRAAVNAQQQPDAEYTRSLPDDQRCGPKPPESQPQVPLG